MEKPDFSKAVVGAAKVLDYLLSPTHQAGRSKARFFQQFGFEPKTWQVLEKALIDHAMRLPVATEANTEFGVKYTINGPLQTPSGERPNVRAVWIVENDTGAPRLVTAYPL